MGSRGRFAALPSLACDLLDGHHPSPGEAMRAWRAPILLVLIGACSSDGAGPSNPPDVPVDLVSTSLDGAVALTWQDNAFNADPSSFQNYRVYSTPRNIDAPVGTDGCDPSWRLEGTTVAAEFLVGALLNGVPRCFSVSAVNLGAAESARSIARFDTPRPDSRNQVIYPIQVDSDSSGFRFWDDDGDNVVEAGELGRVRSGTAADIDFFVNRDGTRLYLTPARAGTGVEFYADGPIDDLTSIDLAPCFPGENPIDCATYSSAPIEAFPGMGYVFEMVAGDEFLRFGAVRVTHVGPSFLILDWSFQTDPGNPELLVGRTR
jgi:hypothetical protein